MSPADETNRSLTLIRISTALAFLATLFLSSKLWLIGRSYPLIPVFDWLPQVSQPYDYLLLGVMVALLLAIMLFRSSGIPVYGFLMVFAVQAILDINRLQPYCYMYCLALICTVTGNAFTQKELRLNTLRLILVGAYFWSGIHKINPKFVNRVFQSIDNIIPADLAAFGDVKYFVLIIPMLEVAFATGLVFPKSRQWAAAALIVMHALIIIVLSPLMKGWNLVVLPWNAAMMVFVAVLFWNKPFSAAELWNPGKSPLKAALTVLVCFMPLLNFFGLWDYYLSFNLYSYKTPYGAIYLDEAHAASLPDDIRRHIRRANNRPYLEATYWIYDELNTLPYPEDRVYRKVRDYVCTFAKDTCKADLVIY